MKGIKDNVPYKLILEKLVDDGAYIFGEILDPVKADYLYKSILQDREFGANLFLTEEEYRKDPQHKGVNPRVGFNLIDKFDTEVSFIEQDQYLKSVLKRLIGDDYTIFNKKIVCGVPDFCIPDWLKIILEDGPINNLGAYVKHEFRDVTFFHGIDFHQDNIDWPKDNGMVDPGELITLYIYIHTVSPLDSPLYLMPKTHKLGATVFPHNLELKKGSEGTWIYSDNQNNTLEAKHLMLTGGPGYAALWHSSTLHGTQGINVSNKESASCRISLRYLLRRSQTNTGKLGLDVVNNTIQAPLFLDNSRVDLDDKGESKVKHNSIKNI